MAVSPFCLLEITELEIFRKNACVASKIAEFVLFSAVNSSVAEKQILKVK